TSAALQSESFRTDKESDKSQDQSYHLKPYNSTKDKIETKSLQVLLKIDIGHVLFSLHYYYKLTKQGKPLNKTRDLSSDL
nr:hypothetical protein [Streptococcus constellatus]